MAIERRIAGEDLAGALAELAELRRFTGAAKEFWPRLLSALGNLSTASRTTLLLKDAASGAWKIMGDWPPNGSPSRLSSIFAGRLQELAVACETESEIIQSLEEDGARTGGSALRQRGSFHFALAVKQRLLNDQKCVAAFLLSEVTEAAAREALLRLQLAADVPRSWQEFLAGQQAKSDIVSFANALDVMAAVNAETRFLAAALAFCNGLATRCAADRVSLGWFQGGYIRMRAISRTEKFNRQMAAVQSLEAAMDECLDQDEEIVWPATADANVVTRDHEKLSREQSSPHICS
jgi:hypothetical protein